MAKFFTPILVSLCFLVPTIGWGQTFTDVTPATMANLWLGSAAWGDYDNDGDLDCLVSGIQPDGSSATLLYANAQGTFSEVSTARFPGLAIGSVDWGDYDNDGDLDLLLTGARVSTTSSPDRQSITWVYLNTGGGHFTQLASAQLPGINLGEAKWGDYNNDGRLDVVMAGNGKTGLFKNLGDGTFAEVPNLNLQFIFTNGRVSWSDYDQDGDLDLFISGWTGNANNDGSAAKLYRNEGQDIFVDVTPATIRGQHRGDAVWGDVDADGDLDLLVAGDFRLNGYDQYYSVLYLNTNSTFTASSQTAFWVVEDGSLAWGDADNDGRLDLLLTSGAVTTTRSLLYHNNGNGTFQELAETQTGLLGFDNSTVVWGDYDNDGDLDLLLIGRYNGSTKIYRNNTARFNQRPRPPATTSVTVGRDNTAVLAWTSGSDDTTPALGLNYNVYVGKATNKQSQVSAKANLATGVRQVATLGNAGASLMLPLRDLTGGRYYWGVQAIDASFLGSPFTPEQSFSIPLTASLVIDNAVACTDAPVQVTYTGNAAETAQFTWDFGGGVVRAGTGRGPYLIQWATAGAKTVRVTVTDDGLVAPQATAQCMVTSRPTAHLTGDSLLCDRLPATLSVALTGVAPWHLTYMRDTIRQHVTVEASPYRFRTDSAGVYRVVALTDASGCAGFIRNDSVHVKPCSREIVAYPNPSPGILRLGSSARLKPGMITVWNLQGQIVWEKVLPGAEFGTALTLPLPSGLYLLQVVVEGQTSRQKVAISR